MTEQGPSIWALALQSSITDAVRITAFLTNLGRDVEMINTDTPTINSTLKINCLITLVLAITFFAAIPASADEQVPKDLTKVKPKDLKPLKVFILAGQSNMQGHAEISTFDSMADDPKTAAILSEMRTADGKPRVCEKVWISSVGCAGDGWKDVIEQKGKLTAGFGASTEKIGPEFTFGITMEKLLDEPILIIKTSWGGRSLHTDFRPPGAGPYVFSDYELTQCKRRGDDLEKIKTDKAKATGLFHRHMIEHVRKVLANIKRVVPEFDPKQGYELAGFVWFQGFNDLVSDWTYEKQMKPGGYDMYGELLAQFIRDVRKDLSASKLPFVIGVMGIGGVQEGKKAPQMYFRQAQAAPASLPEFMGNVVAVQTAPFWDDELDALHERWEKLNEKLDQHANKNPNLTREAQDEARKKAIAENFMPEELKRLKGVSNGGYHYLGAAKILAPIGKAFAEALVGKSNREGPTLNSLPTPVKADDGPPKTAEMAGYLIVPHEKVDAKFNAGFSMYVAAWPLLKNYPGQEFQSGLFGTWMFAQLDVPEPEKHYSDIEGGLGWWRDTRFATETPKFIMGGVALDFCEWANGPAAGKGRDWKKPAGHYAVAQLSPWVLWPPDGLNLMQGTCGELFGYGYLPLPLTRARKTTAGKDVPTGDHCWTLFLATGNFKGPVAFFTPYFWSRPSVENPKLSGLFLDSRPSEPNKALQMETQHVPAFLAKDAKGDAYARVAPTLFPGQPDADSVLVHRIMAYSKAALWDGVQAWFDGGQAVSGAIDPKATGVHTFSGKGGATWQIYLPEAPREKKVPLAWSSFATPVALNDTTYGYRWSKDLVSKADAKDGSLVTLPEFYRMEKDRTGKDQWVVVNAKDVPTETGLVKTEFPRPPKAAQEPYVTPDDADSCWKKPGPAAGPFEAKLGDGSAATYYWYRFADQPALLNADMTDAERETLQKRVEMLHRNWTKDRDYLPPPTVGKLADLDPAVLVNPPKGLEVGYVPIVTRQAAKD
jgi:Carbohydrate esterase, sialic acid-specific acetylesterase